MNRPGLFDMNALRSVIVLGFGLLMGAGQTVRAEQEKAQDSVYQWGRWAVLSPAAGGEPYVAALEPDAANNARPGEASEFQPTVILSGAPPPPRGHQPHRFQSDGRRHLGGALLALAEHDGDLTHVQPGAGGSPP